MTPGEPAPPRSIVSLVREGVLDAELAALLWLLVEAHLPLVVVGAPGSGRSRVRAALLDTLPADVRRVTLAGEGEDFEWLAEATELGWRHERRTAASARVATRVSPATAVLVADLGERSPDGTWGARARILIRALALGYAIAVTIEGDGLEGVLGTLKAPPVSADDDELSRLGLVLVVRAVDPVARDGVQGRRRIVAAHYVRPVARDEHGHVQRMPPAVLATWDAKVDRFEHFAWGIATELAGLTSRRPADLEREQARRARDLADLVVGSG